MENNKLERIIFKLVRIIGIVAIIGGYLGEEILFKYNTLTVGHVTFISPILIIKMIVTIALYSIFIRFLEKHLSIKKKTV